MSATIVRYNDSRLQYTPPLGWAGATVPYTRPEYNMPVKDNAGVLLGFIGKIPSSQLTRIYVMVTRFP